MKIGIIGGGQLALMMIQSQPHHEYFVLEPKIKNSVVGFATILNQPYDDVNALHKLMNTCDVITYEFENIPSDALSIIQSKLLPNSQLLQISQNRMFEKNNAKKANIPTTIFHPINNVADLEIILKNSKNHKWVLKTNTGGYDGKGQIVITNTTITPEIINMLKSNECILEQWVAFEYETSIIMTRDSKNNYAYLQPTKNIHKNNMLWITHNLDEIQFVDKMVSHVKKLMSMLNVIGTLAVEFFITSDGPVFNEMAPRPHNSGHWSIEGTTSSQFNNHINAVTNTKLIQPINIGYTAMINLIGDVYTNAKKIIQFNKNVILHDYFKDKVVENRKMGHITINYSSKEQVLNKLQEIKQLLF